MGETERVGFVDWLARKGTVAETARTVGQQYVALKGENPQEEDAKIFGAIIMARGKAVRYTFDKFRAMVAAAADGGSLTEFVTQIVLIESNQTASELGEGPLRAIVGAVAAELSKLGLE